MTKQTFEVKKIIESFESAGFSGFVLYSYMKELKCIQMTSKYQRKECFIIIPNTYRVRVEKSNHELHPLEIDYKTKLQRDYMSSIELNNIVCKSTKNICIKSSNQYMVYEIDKEYNETPDNEMEYDSVTSESEEFDFVHLGEFEVGKIFPYFLLPNVIKDLKQFEFEKLLPLTNHLESFEIESNEKKVEHLNQLFLKQSNDMHNKLYSIHKNIYNLRHDIKEFSVRLQKAYQLKENSLHSKDTVRFELDRLIVDIENSIDKMNFKLLLERQKSDTLIQKYSYYLSSFDKID